MRGSRISIVALIAVFVASGAIAGASGVGTSSVTARIGSPFRATGRGTHQAHVAYGVTSFPNQGIRISAPANRSAVTKANVLVVAASFATQAPDLGLVSAKSRTGAPIVELATVTPGAFAHSIPGRSYQAWVVIYRGTTTFYIGTPSGGHLPPPAHDCTSFGIERLSTGRWVDFGQTCGTHGFT